MKTFVVDTNVLLHDPDCLTAFKNSELVIPLTVLDELDNAKTRPDAVGRNARMAVRNLDELRQRGSLSEGVENSGVIVRVELNHRDNVPKGLSCEKKDNLIISTALGLQKNGKNIVVVSKDINLRVKCDVLGLKAEDYESNKLVEDPDLIYNGIKTIEESSEFIDRAYAGEEIKIDGFPNQFVIVKSNTRDNHSGAFRIINGSLKPIKTIKGAFDINPRNLEQKMAFDALFDPKIKLVTLIGKAGSGKTLLAMASGLQQVLNNGNQYNKLIVSRPVQPMGKDLGYLPGPQPLDAKVLTPTGWKLMGELKIGDYVIARDGYPTKILNIYPKGIKSVFKISTEDGSTTECCEDHLWKTQTFEEKKRNKSGQIRSTKEIMNSLFTKKGKCNHYLPRNDAVHYLKQELKISPYVLGVLLGDGSLGNSVSFANCDKELIDRVERELADLKCETSRQSNSISYNIKERLRKHNKPAQTIKITNIKTKEFKLFESIGECEKSYLVNKGILYNRCKRGKIVDEMKYEFLPLDKRWQNPIKEELFKLNLLGLHAYDKFIPDQYKYSSIEDRINLLRGLMDTDGSIKKNGEASFTTISRQLALDVIEIVKSLGGRARLRKRNRIGNKSVLKNRTIYTRFESFEFNISLPKHINPFYVSRKANRHKTEYIHYNKIEKIEYVGEKEVQCILIDNPEHLYITDDFIITHNTIEEKLSPWIQPLYDSLEVLLGSDQSMISLYKDQGLIQIEALTYIRGRSIPKSFIIVDEIQNLSPSEVKTIITRAGEDTKIVMTGDIFQIDRQDVDFADNGLTYVVEKFRDYPIAAHITLKKCERSELADLAAKIL